MKTSVDCCVCGRSRSPPFAPRQSPFFPSCPVSPRYSQGFHLLGLGLG